MKLSAVALPSLHTPVKGSCKSVHTLRVSLHHTMLSSSHQHTDVSSEKSMMRSALPFSSVEAEDFDSLSECLNWCRDKRNKGQSNVGPAYLFFCHTLCPYAERVWLALLEVERFRERFVLIHVDLSNKPKWYLDEVHPRGLVPSVLVDHNAEDIANDIHIESIDICMWILGEKDGVGGDVDALVSAALEAIRGNGRYWGIGTSIQKRQQDDFERACRSVFQNPSRIHPSSLSALEAIALFPFMYRAQVAMKSAYGIDIGHMCDGQVGQWMESMISRESSSTTCAREDLLAIAFERHKSLDFFDYVPYGMFDLHPHLTQP